MQACFVHLENEAFVTGHDRGLGAVQGSGRDPGFGTAQVNQRPRTLGLERELSLQIDQVVFDASSQFTATRIIWFVRFGLMLELFELREQFLILLRREHDHVRDKTGGLPDLFANDQNGASRQLEHVEREQIWRRRGLCRRFSRIFARALRVPAPRRIGHPLGRGQHHGDAQQAQPTMKRQHDGAHMRPGHRDSATHGPGLQK